MLVKFLDGTEKEIKTLSYADLTGIILRNADLSGAILRGVDLSGADLSYADLSGAILRGVNLNNANLSRAILRGADLSKAILRGADLSYASLSGAILRGADLDFSTLPLWCGSFDIKVDTDFVYQILYHICRMKFEDSDGIKKLITPLANKARIIKEHNLYELEN